MIAPKDAALRWDHGLADGVVTSAYASVTLISPMADPSEGPNVISLDINSDGDGFRWSAYYGVEDDAPFNEGEIKWGSATDLEQAKRDAWAEAYRFLIGLQYTDAEIANAVPRPPGSMELDMDEGDDDEE